jgi:shikimate kinase
VVTLVRARARTGNLARWKAKPPCARKEEPLGTLLLLAGPKGVGKSWVAEIAEHDLGVHYLDADLLILARLENGSGPNPEDGWLEPVQAAVVDALARYPAVSVEVTGSWESDYKLARNAEARGHRVLRLWISAPLEETLARLRTRATRKVPVTETEARSIYERAQERAARERWDATIDTSGPEQPGRAAEVIRHLLEDHA